MADVKLRYIKEYRDRHGIVRRYLRRRGSPSVALPGKPGSLKFMQAYNAAIAGSAVVSRPRRKAADAVSEVIIGFYKSATFTNLKPRSQKVYRIVLNALLRSMATDQCATCQLTRLGSSLRRSARPSREWRTLPGKSCTGS